MSKLVYYTEQRAFLTDYVQAPAEDSFAHLNYPACYRIKKSFLRRYCRYSRNC